MRVVACVGLVMAVLALAGCNHLGKKAPTASAGGANPPDIARPFNPGNPPVASAGPAPTAGNTSLLAGQVLGGFGSHPPLTYIQVKLAPEGHQPAGAPIDVEASKEGYFTIQGLQPGRHYQLIARAKDGSHQLAGVAYATPPNPRLVIRLSESFQNADTPAIPPPPSWPGPSAGAGNAVKESPAPPPAWPTQPPADPSWVPVPRPAYNPYGGNPNPTPPSGAGIAAPATKPPDPTNIAQGAQALNLTQPALIPGPAAAPPVPTVVPSCVLTGNQLVNFALNDLAGRPWEFRNHRSRLTLIDFWETRCMPCQRAVPHLNVLQQKYGNYGLAVVGIAYEVGTPQQQAQKVERVCGRLRINYTLLLGGGNGRPCPVQTQFAIRAFPTLVLVDETGRVLWRSEGFERQQLAELELILRQRLLAR